MMFTLQRLKVYLVLAMAGVLVILVGLAGNFYNRVSQLESQSESSFQKKDFSGQAAALEELYKMEPWRKNLQVRIAEANFMANDYTNALPWYERAATNTKLGFSELLHYAESLAETDQINPARDLFRDLGSQGTTNSEELKSIVQAQRLLGDLEGASDTLATWKKTGSDSKVRDLSYKYALFQLVFYPTSSIPALEEAVESNPSLRTRLSPFIQILEENSSLDATAWSEIGQNLFNLGEWDLAEAVYQKSVSASPRNADDWAMLGQSKVMQGKDGYPDLVKAQQLNGISVLARYFLAIYWREHGQTGLALNYLQGLSREQPRESLWQEELGNTAFAAGDTTRALQYYQAATDIEPEKVSVWQALAEFSLANGVDINGVGEAAVQKAILLAPDDPTSNDLMGWLLLTRGDEDNAAKFVRKAVASDPTSARNHLHYGQVLREMGDLESARSEFLQVVALDPKGSAGLAAKRILGQYFQRK